ncbi:MAG: DNA-binding protein [Microbacteriaceae bacterium]
MFVLTVDQIGSRSRSDAVSPALRALGERLPEAPLAPERTSGGEFQVLLPAPDRALDTLLWLARTGTWSIGLGIGTVARPLPASIREAAGEAFAAARTAVERAKRRPHRVAVEAPAAAEAATRFCALLELLLAVRARRSAEGWELQELLASGLTQSAAAERLGISPQAVSRRAQAADLKADAAAAAALAGLLAELDAPAGGAGTGAEGRQP